MTTEAHNSRLVQLSDRIKGASTVEELNAVRDEFRGEVKQMDRESQMWLWCEVLSAEWCLLNPGLPAEVIERQRRKSGTNRP